MNSYQGWSTLPEEDDEVEHTTVVHQTDTAYGSINSAPVALPKKEEEEEEAYAGSHGHGHGHGIARLLKLAKSTGPLTRLARVASKEWLYLIPGIIGLLLSTAINVFMPYSLGSILKDGLNQGSFEAVVRITLFFLIIYLFGACMTSVRVYFFTVAGERIVRSLRLRLYSSLLNQPMSFFSEARPGELVNRISADCELIRITLTNTIVVMSRFGLQIIGGSAFLFYLSWSLTLVMLSVAPILGIAGLIYSNRARSLGRVLQNALADNTAVVGEVLSGVQHVRIFDQEKYEEKRYEGLLNKTFLIARKLGFASAIFMGGAEFGAYAAVLAVILFGTYLLINGKFSVDFITSFVLYAVYVAHALGALSHQGAELARAAGASERVFELLDRIGITVSDSQQPSSQPPLKGDIEFSNVVFEYPVVSGQKVVGPVLRSMSFKINVGETVGIVGPSGAGKSTILQLLPRLYNVSSGIIRIDGKDISSYDPHWLRRQIAFVTQEPVLFHGTIRENILYGRIDATDEQIVEAAKAALIHDTILSLPQGYSTVVGDRGLGLSGGQKQRISVARAFLKDAPIVVLDEPTSALDTENENLVAQAINNLYSGRTCIVVTHTSDLLRKADKIIVVVAGSTESVGTQSELLANSTTYKRLFGQDLS